MTIQSPQNPEPERQKKAPDPSEYTKNGRIDKSISATQRFADFFKDQIGIFGTLISTFPIITSYFDIITQELKYVTLSTTIICASFFFAVFWYRDVIIRRIKGWTLLWGISLVTLGIIILIGFIEYLPFAPNATDIKKVQHVKLEHIWSILSYILGFATLTTGISLISIYGFVREGERHFYLLDYITKITPEQWDFAQDLIYSLSVINEKIQTPGPSLKARQSLEKCARYFYNNTRKMFRNLDKGEVLVLGPGPNMSIILNFFLTETKRLRALSYNDVSLWSDKKAREEHLKRFEKINRKERIFVIPKTLFPDGFDRFFRGAILDQILKKNIEVRIAIAEFLPPDICSSTKLDFGILDLGDSENLTPSDSGRDETIGGSKRNVTITENPASTFSGNAVLGNAVFFWRGERYPGYREFSIVIDPETCNENDAIYERIVDYCVIKYERDKNGKYIKDVKDVREATRITNNEELEETIKNIIIDIKSYDESREK